MKLVVVSVHDSAANAFGRPIFVPTTNIAVRSFQDEVNRSSPDNEMFKHPDDFVMYHLADFDDEIGLISSLERPVVVARAKDLVHPS